jgi:hypothetical protein
MVVRLPVGKQPGLPGQYATNSYRANNTPNFADRKIKRLIAELPPTDRNRAPPIRLKSFLLATRERLLLLLGG